MKKIEVTDETYEFLKDLGRELKEQDNRGTRHPIIYGITSDHEEPVYHNEQADVLHLVCNDKSYTVSEALKMLLQEGGYVEHEIKLLIEEVDDDNLSDDDIAQAITESPDATETLVKLLSKTTGEAVNLVFSSINNRIDINNPMMFLTGRECKKHIVRQRHNLNANPRTYVFYMGCDTELERLLGIIQEMTKE